MNNKTSFISRELLEKSLEDKQSSNYFQYWSKGLGLDIATEAVEKYKVGTLEELLTPIVFFQ